MKYYVILIKILYLLYNLLSNLIILEYKYINKSKLV